MTKVKTAGGRFDHDEQNIYFLAGHNIVEIATVHPWNLVAANEVVIGQSESRPSGYNELSERTLHGKVLFDSGIFWLTQQHMRANPGLTMEDALALAPDDIDGFAELRDVYVKVAREMEPDLWGYIELDQGGAENKRKTRADLEAQGLRPIPVYHPLNDGWDYFDELCQRYDRICFGNVVQANREARRHLLATLWERRRRYPDVWVHVLGLSVCDLTTVYPVSSCDSSAWVYAIRFGVGSGPGGSSMGDSFGGFPSSLSYDPERERLAKGGQRHAVHFIGSEAFFMQRTMRSFNADRITEFGADALLPKPDKRERVRT